MNALLREVRIPDLGEGVDSGTVVAIRVRRGESVVAEQSLIELETDKVTLDIPSLVAGVVHEIRCRENDVLHPGELVVLLESAGATSAPVTTEASTASPVPTALPVSMARAPDPSRGAAPAAAGLADSPRAIVAAGPGARREARQLGIAIDAVAGSGARGRITKADVRRHVRGRATAVTPPLSSSSGAAPDSPDPAAFGPAHRVALTRIEQATARNMARAASEIPQAWIERKVDLTLLEAARRELRDAQPADAAPVTLTAVLCKVVALTLAEFPRFNAAYDARGFEIVYRDYLNIGVAVDTPRGLLVPVIRDAGRASIRQIAERLQAVSRAAREGTLAPDACAGGGFTLTNLGGLGVTALQPIVNWPEVAILGVAAFDEMLVQTARGIETRRKLPLTLGFDHRVINGADAARFLARMSELLAAPMRLAVEL